MPIYEYVCDCCHREMEKLEPMSRAQGIPCPDCGSDMRRKLATNPLFLGDIASKRHFKPSDYGRQGF